ncbi:MAG: hypothetical protein H6555_08375 [Lewinellaceae bacterium]|nr:hypothetical protein [Lewinellaceae bacterium]
MEHYPRQISEAEVLELFVFVRTKYVHYYDLQLELVDHLSSALEARWQEDPQLSFKQALAEEYAKFGFAGFSRIITQRQGEYAKRLFPALGQELLTWLQPPRVVLVLGLIGSLIVALPQHPWLFFLPTAVILLVQLPFLRLFKQYRKEFYHQKRRLLGVEVHLGNPLLLLLIMQMQLQLVDDYQRLGNFLSTCPSWQLGLVATAITLVNIGTWEWVRITQNHLQATMLTFAR